MASYTADQLRQGTPVEAISGNKTFTLTNANKGTCYFSIETIANATGSYDSSSPKNAIGTYGSFTDINADSLVTSSYIASVIIPSGGGSFQFNPTTNIAVSSSMLRATGGATLTIS